MKHLYFSAFLQGFFTGTIEQIVYSMAGDFFELKFRVRAQIVFTMIGLLHFPFVYLISDLIHYCGWRQSWKLIGGITVCLGVLCLLTVKDPKQSIEINIDSDFENEIQNQNDLHIKRTENKAIIERKTNGIRKIANDYKVGLWCIFTNYKAYLVIIAFMGRLFNSTIKDMYLTNYFKSQYPEHFLTIVAQAALAGLICVPLFSVLQTMLIEFINKRTKATVPYIVIGKGFFDMVSNLLIFFQTSSYMTSIIGLYIDFALTKGQPGLYIITLATVVDERAANFVVIVIVVF